MHPFRAALEARDHDAAASLLAENVEFRSPIVFKPYHGRDAVATILAGVAHVLKGWTCQREIGGSEQPDHALVFKGRIGDKEIEGCDFLHVNQDGLIDGFYVMVRPLSAALTLAEAMKRHLATGASEAQPEQTAAC